MCGVTIQFGTTGGTWLGRKLEALEQVPEADIAPQKPVTFEYKPLTLKRYAELTRIMTRKTKKK